MKPTAILTYFRVEFDVYDDVRRAVRCFRVSARKFGHEPDEPATNKTFIRPFRLSLRLNRQKLTKNRLSSYSNH